MDSALAWVGQIAEWISQFIPRWAIIEGTHGGVKFVRGSKVIPLAAGIHWWWPVTTKIQTYPVARQTIPTRSQALVTADDKVIEVAGMVTYRIHDIKAILADTFDPDNTIEETAMSVIGRICCRMTWEDLKVGRETGKLDGTLRSALRSELKRYGVTVDKATLTDLAPCRVVKLIQTVGKDG